MREPAYSGVGWELYVGDCLAVLPELPSGAASAIVTDPPYSSGGAFRGDRTNTALAKYVRTETQHLYTDFTGDNRDQRSFLAWCSLWLAAARSVIEPGGVLCAFSDWRQVPILTDAVQCGGWTWRNLGTWWKPGCRMQKGRFSSSAEYVIYGTNGPHASDGECSPQNVFSFATMQTEDKSHIAEKPIEVVEWVLGLARAECAVLDPFTGSGAFGEACLRTGRRFIGIEIDEHYAQIAAKRLARAEADVRNSLPFPEPEPQPKQVTMWEASDA